MILHSIKSILWHSSRRLVSTCQWVQYTPIGTSFQCRQLSRMQAALESRTIAINFFNNAILNRTISFKLMILKLLHISFTSLLTSVRPRIFNLKTHTTHVKFNSNGRSSRSVLQFDFARVAGDGRAYPTIFSRANEWPIASHDITPPPPPSPPHHIPRQWDTPIVASI